MTDLNIVRNAVYDTIPAEPFNSGKPPDPQQMYIPSAHRESLRLSSNLIIGSRGTGKSTWTAALADQKLRKIIGTDIPELTNTKVQIGFAENPNQDVYPTQEIFINLLQKKFKPYEIWQTVVFRWLCGETGNKIPGKDWEDTVNWVKKNPEPWAKILQKANDLFRSHGSNGLILFDALDRSSNDWEKMNDIVRDLLRLVIRLKTYSNIHTKVFLREDQCSSAVTNFPDASKLLSTKTNLDWYLYDLHGLLWHLLCNAQGKGGVFFRSTYKNIVGSALVLKDDCWIIHDKVKRDEKIQRDLFEKLAGPWMGKDRRRGVPYIWSVSHLADGIKRTSPRSFLTAIRAAAGDSRNKNSEYPLHYESIRHGVQKASSFRINEIAEDYPWIRDLCQLLQNLNVTIEFKQIEEFWIKEYPHGPADIKSEQLPPQNPDQGWYGIQKELIRLGIFEEMRDGRINMPDLYRIGFGLGRKGGVTPLHKENIKM
jgi:hypothetical protein